jgi:hypothetical protein
MRKINFETCEKHKPEFAQIGKEVGDRPGLAKKSQAMRSYDDAAEQQSHHRRKTDAPRERRDTDDQCHSETKFRQVGHCNSLALTNSNNAPALLQQLISN